MIFGTDAGFGAGIDLATLTPSRGFVINGVDASDWSGYSVSSAGDVNGDGLDDLIVGARGADSAGYAKSYAGESYVIFGTTTGRRCEPRLGGANPGAGLCDLGADKFDTSGHSVSSAGDVNGDGFDDLVVGAPGAQHRCWRELCNLRHGCGFRSEPRPGGAHAFAGLRHQGGRCADLLGYSVSSAGDVNGDGFDDLIVGAPSRG